MTAIKEVLGTLSEKRKKRTKMKKLVEWRGTCDGKGLTRCIKGICTLFDTFWATRPIVF